MNESEVGLPATGEEVQETTPADEVSDGQEPETGAAEKEPAAEPASSGDDPDGEVPKGVRKRIQRAVRDRDVAVGRAANAEGEVEALRARLAKYETPEQAAPRTEAAPKSDNSDFRAQVDDFIEDGLDKYEDFEEVTRDNPRMRTTQTMVKAMMDADNGVDIAYYLGQNPREARRISKLGETQQVREIVLLEKSLATPKASVKPKVSSAPTPIEPVGGKGTAPAKLTGDESMDDFFRKFNSGRKRVVGRTSF